MSEDLLHLETQKDRIEEIRQKMPTLSRFVIEDIQYLFVLVEEAIKTRDTSELEEWAR